jgi:hypothetical protein
MSDQQIICESIINGLDDLLTVAEEGYSDISQFMSDPENYLNITYRNADIHGDATLYTAPLSTGGEVFVTIDKACQELVKVNAFTEALAIYQSFLDTIYSIRDGLSKQELQNLDWTIDEVKSKILEIMKDRDEYTSKRKSTIARYSALVSKTK